MNHQTEKRVTVLHGRGNIQSSSSNTALRAAAIGLAGSLIALLMVASQLTPSPNGLGTHQQLGLPPCTMRVLAGIRCPGCGMTTSWALFMNGRWGESISANLGGFLLAMYSIGFVAVSSKVALSGRLPSVDAQRILAMTLLAIATVTLVNWGWTLLA
jgi:hypothetical protein